MKTTPTESNSATLDPGQPANGSELDPMEVARAADAEEPGTPTIQTAKTDAVQKTEGTPKVDAKPGEQGNNGKPAADGTAKLEAKKDQTQLKTGEESEFTKAKKERDRQEGLLKNFQAEKETFRAEKGALMSQMDALRREVTQLRQKTQSGEARDTRGLTAKQYEELADKYRKDGNDEMATAARDAAEALRKQGGPVQTANVDPWKTPEFQTEWNQHRDEIVRTEPELGNPENPLFQATNKLVNDPQWGQFFRALPSGIKAAVEVAKLMQANNAAKELQAKLTAAEAETTKHKAEVDRLNALLQPRGGLPPTPVTKGEGGDLSTDQVLEIAKAADRGET